MSTFERREADRQVTLNRIGGRKAVLFQAEYVLACRARRLRELPIWAHDGIREELIGRFYRALVRASEARHALSVDLAVLGAQGGAGLAAEIRAGLRRMVVEARARGRARDGEKVIAN